MKQNLHGAVLAFIGFFMAVPSVQADQWKGMDMIRYCTGDTLLFDDSVCRAYIQGVVDAHEHYTKEKTAPAFCLPQNNAEREKGESLVPKWLAAFQERWRQKPIVLTADALKAIFPCLGDRGR